ncbi:MAG TPA: glycoside hydrolase family 88 protein [Vicinamibacterales bacterium]|nr:glycoside hydrolase family 88 protein [Vicinamibacterales bacterium]
MVLSLAAAALAVSLQSDLQQVAALAGEPSVVSAAGMTKDDQPVLTLENRSAFDLTDKKYRVVLMGAGAVDGVRWFKTSAPRAVREMCAVSALPSADGLDEASKQRWLTFQAADAVIELAAGQSPAATFNAFRPARSKEHDTLIARIGRDPLAIARQLAAKYPGEPIISYIPSIAWSNALKVADLTKDASLRERVMQQTQPWRSGEKELFGNRIQLTSVAGTFVFAEVGAPELTKKGVDAASRVKDGDVYEYGQGWTDDMFMATVVLARNGQIDLASRMLIAYASRLQRPDGIFIHATNGPHAWGRGNGFAAFGLMEALTAMPANHPSRAPLLDIYRKQMRAIRDQQAPDGMWREVIDEPGAYREETATAMLLTAMARGIRRGWLDASFRPVVDRAWNALAAHVADDGTVIDVCTGTGAGPTKRYYMDRAAITGADDRGGAMALQAAMEIYELRHSPTVAAQ